MTATIVWLPIATAPLDGTIILIGRDDEGYRFVEAAYWSQCPRATGGDAEYPWVTLDQTNGVNGRTADSPSVWADLPAVASITS